MFLSQNKPPEPSGGFFLMTTPFTFVLSFAAQLVRPFRSARLGSRPLMLKNLHALLRFLTEAKQTEAAVRHNCKSYPRSLFLIVSQSCRCVHITSTRYKRLCTQWLSRELCA